MSAAAVASTPPFATKVAPQPASRAKRRQRAFMLVAIIAVTSIGTAGWWPWPNADQIAGTEAKLAPRLSIVVLPFANLSNDPEQEYFADAITEDLTTDLSRITGSFVIATTTAFTYKGKGLGAKQIEANRRRTRSSLRSRG
jgi:hypothetical protein